MSRTGWRDRLLLLVKRTPLHPQWLLQLDSGGFRALLRSARGRVLDIGCADRWIEAVLPAGCDYIGIDYPLTGATLYGSRPDVFADAAQLPFPDHSADTVVLMEVVEHLRQPDRALQEARRVLRPQGRLLFSMPFLYPVHDAPHDFQRLTSHGLARDIAAAGLHVESVRPRLSCVETAALLGCLAIGGTFVHTLRRRHPGGLLAAMLLPLIPLLNLGGWICSRLVPSWPALTNGYIVVASRSGQSD